MEDKKTNRKIPLYRQLASELEAQIESGVFRTGDKLPSIREIAQARKISVITVLKAYQVIEQKGLIHSLPKSGYYISFHKVTNTTQHAIIPQEVHISEKIMDFTRSGASEDSSFGNGLSARDIIPIRQLDKILIHELHKEELSQFASVESEGNDLLRSQIVKYLYMKNIAAVKEQVLITNGCTEAVFLCLSTVCSPGDQIVMQSPCSYGMLQMAETLKLKVIEVNPDPETGIDFSHLQYILNHYDVKALYMNPSVNNPQGTILPKLTKKLIATMVNEKKVFLIEDDVMNDLYFDAEQPQPIKTFDTDGYVVYCSSFTKTLLPTYRVGWVYSERLFNRILQQKKALNVGTQLLQQAVIAELLESGNYARYTRKARKVYAERTRQLREDILDTFPAGTMVTEPEGGFFLWVKLPANVDAASFFSRIGAENIMILPGTLFSLNDSYADCFRINAANYNKGLKPTVIKMSEIARESTNQV